MRETITLPKTNIQNFIVLYQVFFIRKKVFLTFNGKKALIGNPHWVNFK